MKLRKNICPQITQINADYKKAIGALPPSIGIRKGGMFAKVLICENLRNLMELLAIRLGWQNTPTKSLVMRIKSLNLE